MSTVPRRFPYDLVAVMVEALALLTWWGLLVRRRKRAEKEERRKEA